MLKNTQTTIKLILWAILIVALIIGGSFIAGTFYPNGKEQKLVNALLNKIIEDLQT